MWKLIKEVFKSLSKNKVMVIGLSILIFLTSAIFTLLFTLRSTIVTGFNNYKEVSKMQDITVDLNLPTQGTAYNQGYYLNGETLDTLKLKNKKDYSPIKYYVKDPKGEYVNTEENILKLGKDDYIKLSNFKYALDNSDINSEYKDYYIKRSNIENFYDIYKANKNNSLVNFNLGTSIEDANNATFFITENRKFKLYSKEESNYFEILNDISLSLSDSITFDKKYLLSDVMQIKYEKDSENNEIILAYQLSPLYINVKTKEATFDYSKGNKWNYEKEGIILPSHLWISKFGFSKYVNDFVFIQSNKNLDLRKFLEYPNENEVKINENLVFKNNILISDLIDDEKMLTRKSNVYIQFDKNKEIKVSKEYLMQKRTLINFERYNYSTTFNDINKSKWTGAFYTYMESLNKNSKVDSLDKKTLDDLSYFSYWKKIKSTYLLDYSNNSYTNSSIELPINELDLEVLLYNQNEDREEPNGKPYSLNQIYADKILNIDSYIKKLNLSKEEELKQINNSEIRAEKFNFIKSKAYEVTKDKIINEVTNIVGEDNIGLRKTITVDSINEKTNKQNTFHFVNVGNKDSKVENVKLNVGKLFNEEKEKTPLTTISNNVNNVYTSNQVPPYIASLIIQSIGKNLYPNVNYIKPKYIFDNVYDVNPDDSSVNIENSKIVILNKYFKENIKNNDELKAESDKLNLGIIFRGNNYKLVSLVNDNNTIYWKTIYNENFKFNGFDKGFLSKWLEKNNLTISTEFIKTDDLGWVKQDNQLSNLVYIPLEFLSPKAELINEIVSFGKVDFLTEAIQKYLLNDNLVKENFLSEENVFAFSEALKKALNENNFANSFSTSKINQSQLPKIMFDLLYYLSHDEREDVLKSIFNSILEKIKAKILNSSNELEIRKTYLKSEIKNLYNLIFNLTNIKLSDYISTSNLVDISIDPIKFIDSFKIILLGFDIRKFSEFAKNWYENKYGKSVFYLDESYKYKLSSGNIINWFFNSIDQNTIKQGISELIQNLDFEKLLNLENSNSIFSNLINKYAPNLKNSIKKIISKIKVNNSFDTLKKGLINIINNIDLEVLSNELNNSLEINYLKYEINEYNYEKASYDKKIHNISLETIKPSKGIYSLLKGLFLNPGTNRTFKENIVKMLNLSSLTSEITINNSGKDYKILVPKDDSEKLSLTDLLSIFTNTLKNSNSDIFINYIIEKDIENIIKTISNIETNEQNLIYFSKLNISVQNLLKKYNLTFVKIDKNILLNNLQVIKNFNKSTIGGTNLLISEDDKNAADLLLELFNFNEGNSFWKTIKSTLNTLTDNSITNKYALGAQNFNIFVPWIKIISSKEIKNLNNSEIRLFIQDFLNFAIEEEILKEVNTLSETDNLPFYKETGFGITNGFSNPDLITIFNKNNDSYSNSIFEKFINKHKKFEDLIINNKNLFIKLISLIGSSKIYNYSNKYQNGVYYHVVKKYIEKYLITDEFLNNRELLLSVSQKFLLSFPTELFGISEIITNPILRILYPQILISYATTQKDELGNSNGNLANIVLNKLPNFEQIILEKNNEILNLFDLMFENIDTSLKPLDLDKEITLAIDGAMIQTVFDTKKANKVFGLNIIELINNVLNKIVEPKEIKDIVFNNIESYIAKVNYSYLVKNNKAIYNGKIPETNIGLESLINNIDDKYLININGIKFLIVGEDTTIDYIYPIIDENNLQVNTENQALVYVNDSGFSRVQAAYQGNVVKKALLVKNSTSYKNVDLKNKITNIVDSSISDSNKLQRVFLYNEVDPVNPERSLRITTILGVISAVSTSTLILMTIFILLVSVSIIFIIKRYISNKNKVLGILLAQGYKPIEIAWSLTVFAAVTSIIGGVLGYVIGNRGQLFIQNIFSLYWTLPKDAIPFSFFTLFLTVFVPYVGMSLLIIVTTLVALKYKPVDLISGTFEAPSGKTFEKIKKFNSNKNVKKRFAWTLAYNGFGKLASFGVSVLLTSVATMFGLASLNVFKNTINSTYENRNYKFKVDLVTPTTEGGNYLTFKANDLNNSIYVPIGELIEGNRESADFFKPGYSKIINFNGNNGNPKNNESHILTQFSANIKVDSGVAVDPWLVAYNGMPDSQKAKIDSIRDQIGYQLTWTQNLNDDGKYLKIDSNGLLSYEDLEGNKYSFFKYYKSQFDKQGSFVYALWDSSNNEYVKTTIKTGTNERNLYRDFLVKGYKKIAEIISKQEENQLETVDIKNYSISNNNSDYWLADKSDLNKKWVQDYFISFGGVLIDEKYDETYTYIDVNKDNLNYRIYGYSKNIQDKNFIKLVDENNNNLFDKLNEKYDENIYPLVINEVLYNKNYWKVGDIVDFKIQNRIDRNLIELTKKIYGENSKEYQDKLKEYNKKTNIKFKIVGINKTFINNELITTKEVADKLIGFDQNNLFNGVITKNEVPIQVTNSASLYSLSGYWSGYDGFDLSSIDKSTLEKMFDEIYDINNGVLATRHKLNKDEIAKLLTADTNAKFTTDLYKNARESAKENIELFANIYNNKLYIALSLTIDSKDIEVGFTNQVGDTIEQISIFIIVISFAISLIILIIMATIMISENEKNIAIWSILGYTQKEKIKMFFGIFIPFMIVAILLSVGIVFSIIPLFNFFLLTTSSIALSLSLKWWHILITILLIFAIFSITSVLVWRGISKMKPVDLLKGK
ncbi:Uncharacterized ABC transporter permease MG468 homolog [Mycoplasmopsis maculosa]|uniref:Uncharacterized ABC transporter permease MG468 homolog n=1 Tax=Mycoplasmopsis maculosa TaxID=114885 RepID=A0A449B4S6_9BACT|nr:FtsX-like permease family protein [Mycoplasmopsis maculosa]VEU75613.1 Uncharacterized ABC transporter permease MG468 homolog [Mycoplasmopsis maculosa]